MRVGIIGGGQLAWMMATAVDKLKLQLLIQTPCKDDPAVSIADQIIFAPVDDAVATQELAKHCEVITFENEFVDLAALQKLADRRVKFYPKLSSLQPLLDKFDQRQYFQSLGLPTPQFVELTYRGEGPPPSPPIPGFPAVLKTRRHGYDGQGTFILQDAEAWDVTLRSHVNVPLVQEAYVPFQRELAVMAARSPSGEIAIYPVVETVQKNQVCQRVYAPAAVNPAVVQQVEAIARALLTSLDYVGILGIELFLAEGDRVWVNEVAPRTHNSGHYSLDACATSQFEQQLRAVTGQALGPTHLLSPAVMVNLLGFETVKSDYIDQRRALAAIPNAHVYWYGKSESRPGRKLGHVTVRLDSETVSQSVRESAITRICQQIDAIWAAVPGT